jgi:hypothetical protein
MKKTLLFLAFAVVASANSFKAQTTWDFGTWANNPTGEQTPVVKNNLGLVPGETTNFGIVEASSAVFQDGYPGTKRFKLNGGGYDSTGSSSVPTKRYLLIKVNGNSEITVWYKNGSATGERTLFIGTGTSILASNASSDGASGLKYVYQYVGAARDIYIYGDSSLNLYKVTATNVGTTVLGVNDVRKDMKATVYTSGNKLYVSNLDSKNTQVNVFNANGSLVKTVKASADTNFEINNKGLYIVNLKSEAGEKSVKVLIK